MLDWGFRCFVPGVLLGLRCWDRVSWINNIFHVLMIEERFLKQLGVTLLKNIYLALIEGEDRAIVIAIEFIYMVSKRKENHGGKKVSKKKFFAGVR